MRKTIFRKIGITVSATAVASAMVIGSVPQALAATNDASKFWQTPEGAASIDQDLIKTYGVRAGSAGPDFLGITNTNYDYKGSPTDGQYDYTGINYNGVDGARLALWATSVNESANPYYANLFYTAVTGNDSTHATTWTKNSNSWGDSSGESSNVGGKTSGAATIAGLEYQPDIIFGANKKSNWDNLSVADTNLGKAVAEKATPYGSTYNPAIANNDSTNLWTQIYTMNRLAKVADGLKTGTSKKTRYDGNSSQTGALAYEKALRGNLLWIASQIDQNKAKKKTVAYLYAIDASGAGYFFVPEAKNLTNGNDTGKGDTAKVTAPTKDDALADYAGNNGTIDLDYMDTLPFITNTFTGGDAISGGIVMKVEDIYRSNPAHSVSSTQTDALKDVDAIIFNTNTDLVGDAANGTSNGKNESGVSNAETLNATNVATWAKAHGFKDGGKIIAGDDWGTSNRQGFGTAETTEAGMSPMLYCQRNYTTDKPARAAWAFSQLFPEYYEGNADASYAYWVKNVYHVNMNDVPTVVKYFTNQSDTVNYTDAVDKALEQHYQAGLDWWLNTGSKKAEWNQYAYYNGSSRASYYDSAAASEEPKDTIGIFQPTAEWAAMATKATAKKTQSLTVAQSKKTIKYAAVKKKAQTAKITVKKARGTVTFAKAKKSGIYKKLAVSKKGKVTFKKGAKKGTYKVTVKAKATSAYKASKTYTVTFKIK